MDEPSAKTVVVVAGGAPLDAPLLDELRRIEPGAVTVAVDSGIDLARRLERSVDLAVGDFDSVTPEGLRWAEARGAVVERHPVAKDATDLELGLDAALRWSPDRLVVLGGHGGRLDHLLANVALLASDRYRSIEVSAHIGSATVTIVRDDAELRGAAGDLVSLLPVHGDALGVHTSGLRYPLRDKSLSAGSTRGVSNEFVEPVAGVSLRSGVLAVVQPGAPLHPLPTPHQESP